jgi:hypothetical protein
MTTYLRPRRAGQPSTTGSGLPAAFSAGPPQLGYGKPTEATIDQVNIWMRGQPWYQEQMRQWGQDPGHPNLAKSQSEQILKMAQAQGVVVDQGHMEVDDHGNFNPIGHKLRNTLIVLGIAGATIATMGAAGAFSGSALAGSTAATGATGATAGTAGTLAATTTVPLMTGTIAGSVASGAVPAALATGTAAAGTVGGVTAANVLGPSTAANIAGTTAAANSVPAGIAAAGGSSVVPPAVTTGGFTARNFLNSPGGTQIIGSGINAATNLYAANKAANASTEAAQLEAAAKDKELAYLREKDRQDQLNWERTQQFNIDQYNQRLDRLSPYIGMGTAANTTLASLIGGPSMVAATQVPQPHASLPPQAGSPTASGGDLQTAASLFLDGVRQAGLNPVAVQGHGQQIADAVNRIHPELKLTVDPKTDAIVWNGIPLDVTVDSGKGGWSFRPSGPAALSPAAVRPTTASSLFALPSTLAALNDDTSAPMQTPRDTPTTLSNFVRLPAA